MHSTLLASFTYNTSNVFDHFSNFQTTSPVCKPGGETEVGNLSRADYRRRTAGARTNLPESAETGEGPLARWIFGPLGLTIIGIQLKFEGFLPMCVSVN